MVFWGIRIPDVAEMTEKGQCELLSNTSADNQYPRIWGSHYESLHKLSSSCVDAHGVCTVSISTHS
jgi:hypothetical protein